MIRLGTMTLSFHKTRKLGAGIDREGETLTPRHLLSPCPAVWLQPPMGSLPSMYTAHVRSLPQRDVKPVPWLRAGEESTRE